MNDKPIIDCWQIVMTDTEGKSYVQDIGYLPDVCRVIDDVIEGQYKCTWIDESGGS